MEVHSKPAQDKDQPSEGNGMAEANHWQWGEKQNQPPFSPGSVSITATPLFHCGNLGQWEQSEQLFSEI